MPHDTTTPVGFQQKLTGGGVFARGAIPDGSTDEPSVERQRREVIERIKEGAE